MKKIVILLSVLFVSCSADETIYPPKLSGDYLFSMRAGDYNTWKETGTYYIWSDQFVNKDKFGVDEAFDYYVNFTGGSPGGEVNYMYSYHSPGTNRLNNHSEFSAQYEYVDGKLTYENWIEINTLGIDHLKDNRSKYEDRSKRSFNLSVVETDDKNNIVVFILYSQFNGLKSVYAKKGYSYDLKKLGY